MQAYNCFLSGHGRVFSVVVMFLLLPIGLQAQLLVDCSGTNPDEYPSINAALPNATNGSIILVTGTCNENVNLQGWNSLKLGAWFGQTATLNGALSISNSQNIFLYGLNVTNSLVDGVTVSDSTAVFLDSCTSSGNKLNGLRVQNMSDVGVLASGAFDNNGSSGIWSNLNSLVYLNNWAGPVDISNNLLDGIACEQASCLALGNTKIMHNGTVPGAAGIGVFLVGGAKMELAAYYGPNFIEGNISGGISVQGLSTLSTFSFNQGNVVDTLIRGNGTVGVTVGASSEVGLLNTEIANHTSAGIDVYSNSQTVLSAGNKVLRNGSKSDSRSAGIRVEGNSGAFLRGGEVAHNSGPGLLVLVNSSVDFTGVLLSGNDGGIITCDDTAVMVSDLAPAAGVHCRIPHGLGNRSAMTVAPTVPDLSAHKALHEKYRKLATRH
jgi:hypothetical protein